MESNSLGPSAIKLGSPRIRWATAIFGLISFAIAALGARWLDQEGIAVLGFIVVGFLSLLIAAVGVVPGRATWGDKSLEFGSVGTDVVEALDGDDRAEVISRLSSSGNPATRILGNEMRGAFVQGKLIQEFLARQASLVGASDLIAKWHQIGFDLAYRVGDGPIVGVLVRTGSHGNVVGSALSQLAPEAFDAVDHLIIVTPNIENRDNFADVSRYEMSKLSIATSVPGAADLLRDLLLQA